MVDQGVPTDSRRKTNEETSGREEQEEKEDKEGRTESESKRSQPEGCILSFRSLAHRFRLFRTFLRRRLQRAGFDTSIILINFGKTGLRETARRGTWGK